MIAPNVTAYEAEQTVLGVLLKRPDKASAIREMLSADDFGDTTLRGIYIAALNVYDATGSCDLVSADHEFSRLHGGRSATEAIIEACAGYYTAELVGTYCGYVIEASQRRKMQAIADELFRLSREPDTDIPEAIEEAKRSLAGLIREGGEIKTMAEVLLETYDYTERVAKGEITPCASGFATLDQFTGGFFPSELTIVGARPSVGKTAVALMVSTATARETKHVFFASAEMDENQIGQRELADASGVNGMRLRRPKGLTESDWVALAHGMVERGNLPVNFSFARNVDRIIAQARRQKDRGECDMVLVDYVQLLTTSKRFEADRLRVEYISHELKALAKELDVPVIALAQLNRPPRGDKSVPGLESLSDSSALEKDADGVILLHRPALPDDDIFQTFPDDREVLTALHGTGKQLVYFNVAKQRQGITAITASIFDGAHGRFAPLERG